MSEALTVVRDIAAAEFVDYRQMVALGSRCRTAVKRLTAARLDDLPTLSTAGDPLPDALDEMLMLLADVLLVHAEGREVPFKPLRRSVDVGSVRFLTNRRALSRRRRRRWRSRRRRSPGPPRSGQRGGR